MEDHAGFDPKRRLCPDGACTGIVGPDGRCQECGRAAGGGKNPSAAHGADGLAADLDLSEKKGGDGVDASPEGADASGDRVDASGDRDRAGDRAVRTSDGFDPNRRLCDDGACVGIVGSDGACTTCGRVAS